MEDEMGFLDSLFAKKLQPIAEQMNQSVAEKVVPELKAKVEEEQAKVAPLTEQQRAIARSQVLSDIQDARKTAMAQGRQRAEQAFQGAGQDVFFTRGQGAIQSDVGDIIARRRAALAGLTGEESNAMREQELAGITQSEATAARQLRGAQAASGVRGGLAGAQQAALIQQAQNKRAELERQLFLENIRQKQAALGAFEGTIGQEAQQARQRELAKLGIEMGFGQMGSSEAAAAGQIQAGQEGARLNRGREDIAAANAAAYQSEIAKQAMANKGKK
jgi:VIT1/CCC1 family predicted Fe2+/Mn2+ transporter